MHRIRSDIYFGSWCRYIRHPQTALRCRVDPQSRHQRNSLNKSRQAFLSTLHLTLTFHLGTKTSSLPLRTLSRQIPNSTSQLQLGSAMQSLLSTPRLDCRVHLHQCRLPGCSKDFVSERGRECHHFRSGMLTKLSILQ